MISNDNNSSDLGLTLGMLLLRIWLAMRSIQTGIEKFAGTVTSASPVIIDGEPNEYGITREVGDKFYAFSEYHGVPVPLYDKLEAEPFIPAFALVAYDKALGPLLIVLGLTVLIGLATRFSLFLMGLVYTSLTFGLILIKQDAGVAWLGIHVILITFALVLSGHNKFSVLKKW